MASGSEVGGSPADLRSAAVAAPYDKTHICERMVMHSWVGGTSGWSCIRGSAALAAPYNKTHICERMAMHSWVGGTCGTPYNITHLL